LGVVFDMDGVLLDSTACHSQAFSEILIPLGISGFSYPRFAGWRTPEVFRTVFLEADLPMTEAEIADCSKRKSARSRELLEVNSQIFTRCAAVVWKLAALYPLALASSGSRGSVENFIERSGLGSAFRVVVSGDDVSRAKPDPEVFTRAIAGLLLPPSRCVVLEDAESGIQAARAAGAIACGFGADPNGVLQRAGANCRIESLGELPPLLERLRSL
jgi:beta-phosphoglucomutase